MELYLILKIQESINLLNTEGKEYFLENTCLGSKLKKLFLNISYDEIVKVSNLSSIEKLFFIYIYGNPMASSASYRCIKKRLSRIRISFNKKNNINFTNQVLFNLVCKINLKNNLFN